MVIPLNRLLLLILSEPIFHAKIKYINVSLDVSIVSLPVPALILFLHSPLLNLAVMILIHITTRLHSMLWSISPAQINTAPPFTPDCHLQFSLSITSPIITTKRLTLMQNLPSPYECHQLTAFCEAFWGVQFGSTVDDETPLELFKFLSLSGFLTCFSGSPISWK